MAPWILTLLAAVALAVSVDAGDLFLNTGGPNLPNGFRCDTGKFSNKGRKYTGLEESLANGGWKKVYQSHGYPSSPATDLEYKIPVEDGSYTVFLLFGETTNTAPNQRLFTVKINGVAQSNGAFNPGGILDVFKAGGGQKNGAFFFNTGAQSPVGGFITVTLGRIAGKENPMVSGIAIMGANADAKVGTEGLGSCASDPAVPNPSGGVIEPPKPLPPPAGGCKPVTTGQAADKNDFRMNVGGGSVSRINFGGDNVDYIVESNIGLIGTPSTPVVDNRSWGEPQQNYRYTLAPTLTYKIPVGTGTYNVGLLFTESFFKEAGKRTFDILINGDVKATAFDAFASQGYKKPGYKGYGGIKGVGGFITIQFKKVVENPFVNGIVITGAGAGATAIGGPDTGPAKTKGSCDGTGPPPPPPPPPPPGTCDDKDVDTEFSSAHTAHAVLSPIVETDFKKEGFATVTLDGTLSHSHFQSATETGKILKWTWTWKDSTHPERDPATDIVTVTGKKVTQAFPLGVTTVKLRVVDQVCNVSEDEATVTVNSATKPGAYCYYYDFGNQNPATVPLPQNPKLGQKPQKGQDVGDIDFLNNAAFGGVPFNSNTFAVRCTYFLDVKTAGAIEYKLLHSGPVKAYQDGALVASSDSKAANRMTMTTKKTFDVGLHQWQVIYLKPKALQAKLVFQFSSGVVIPPSTISHDSGSTLPVITNIDKTAGVQDTLVLVIGTAFVNGVIVKFGTETAEIIESDAGTVQVRAPAGTGVVPVTVSTEAGVSNSFDFTYTKSSGETCSFPLKFTKESLKTTGGEDHVIKQIAVVKFGPDGRLYCGALNSMLHALTLNKALQVTKRVTKNVKETWDRAVLGLAFDPSKNSLRLLFSTSTTSWGVSKNNPVPTIPDAAVGWKNGKIQAVTMSGPNGDFNDDVTDVVTGLPISNHDHSVQAFEFLPNGKFVFSIGGFTNGGVAVPDDRLGGYPASPLTGALVECPSTGVTNMQYSTALPEAGTTVTGGACKVYAPGLRNSFGIRVHTNGKLYATDNGPNKDYGKFITDCTGGLTQAKDIPDKLFLIEPGRCHGHPNINRGLKGAPAQCKFDDASCVKPIVQNLQSSTNGIVEYRSNIFGAEVQGNLFLSKFAGASNAGRMSRVVLNGSGGVAANGLTNQFWGASGLSIEESVWGDLVMSQVYMSKIIVLRPSYPAPATKTCFISVMPRRGPAAGGNKVTVAGHNFGATPTATFGTKACTNVQSIDDDTFTCTVPAGVKGSQVKVTIAGTSGSVGGVSSDYWYN